MLGLVEWRVVERAVLDISNAVCEFIPIRTSANFEAPVPTKGTSLVSCAALPSVGNFRNWPISGIIETNDCDTYKKRAMILYAKADAQRGRKGGSGRKALCGRPRHVGFSARCSLPRSAVEAAQGR